jgi:hypothetical protein
LILKIGCCHTINAIFGSEDSITFCSARLGLEVLNP